MSNKSKSFGILEVLLSAFIFVILIGGVSIIVKRTVSASSAAMDRQIALNFAQEGIEAVQQYHLTNILSTKNSEIIDTAFNVFDASLSDLAPAQWDLTKNTSITSNTDWDNVGSRETLKPYASNQNYEFSRMISITNDITNSYYIIKCRVAWDTSLETGPNHHLDLATIITY